MINGLTILTLSIVVGYIYFLRQMLKNAESGKSQWRQTAIELSAKLNTIKNNPMGFNTYQTLKAIGESEVK